MAYFNWIMLSCVSGCWTLYRFHRKSDSRTFHLLICSHGENTAVCEILPRKKWMLSIRGISSMVNVEEELTEWRPRWRNFINDTLHFPFPWRQHEAVPQKAKGETLKLGVVALQGDRVHRLLSLHCCKQVCCRKVANHILTSRCKFQLV